MFSKAIIMAAAGKTVEVLCPTGRRQKVKVNPSMTVFQVKSIIVIFLYSAGCLWGEMEQSLRVSAFLTSLLGELSKGLQLNPFIQSFFLASNAGVSVIKSSNQL